MTPYLAMFHASFRTQLQYRAAAWAGVGTQVFWGLIRMMIFWAFYQSVSSPQPMSYEQTLTYIWLGQAMIVLIFFRVDGEVASMIRSGTIAYELVRPVNLYGLWFCRSVASRTAPLLLRMIPILIVSGLFLGLRPPASWECAALWLLSSASAILLSASISALMTVGTLWTIAGDGLNRLLPVAFYFLSGSVLPLPLFPDWAQPILKILPARGLMDTPFRIYLGHIPPSEALAAIAHQLAWVGIAVWIGYRLLARGLKRVEVQGG